MVDTLTGKRAMDFLALAGAGSVLSVLIGILTFRCFLPTQMDHRRGPKGPPSYILNENI